MQALLAVKSVPVEEDPDTEVPTHPEDGNPQPGNSKVSRKRKPEGWAASWAEVDPAGGALPVSIRPSGTVRRVAP